MRNRSPWRDRIQPWLDATPSNPAPPGSRLASFRRLYRWLNLTLVHQGAWPLLILLLAAPPVRPAVAPWPWIVAAIAAPACAAGAALLYLAQRRPDVDSGPSGRSGGAGIEPAPSIVADALRSQVRLLLFGVTFVLAIGRLVLGPPLPTGAFLLFGIADVLAFQLIHFGVVAGSFVEGDQGQAAAVLLFGLSWGLRELFLAGVGAGNAELGLAFGSGVAVGLGVGLLSRLLRRWPGGFWAAAAGHWLLIYLVLGFVG